ncbi:MULTISPECIES: hypothetical protein [Microcoleaceae]|nr:hypothetical protein [Tychonema sp. LEGE 06208]MBE9165816.1 hypothetical protein [Tychonema sp. LEGE 06208]
MLTIHDFESQAFYSVFDKMHDLSLACVVNSVLIADTLIAIALKTI